MSLPLPDQTFVKMPAVQMAAATEAAFINAMSASAASATDYRGTAVPATHQWVWGQEGTVAVYASPPVGTLTDFNPGLAWGFSAVSTLILPGNAGAGGRVYHGIAKGIGAWGAWNSANPWNASYFPGNWITSTDVSLVQSWVQVYQSQEMIVVDMWKDAVTRSFSISGAIAAPYTDTRNTSEVDSRIYGMIGSGINLVDAAFLSTGAAFLSHSTTSNAYHAMTFVPELDAYYLVGKDTVFSAATASAMTADLAGAWVGRPITLAISTATTTQNGFALGTLRGITALGSVQAGRTRRDGATDLFHAIGVNSGAAGAALALAAVP